MKNEKNDVDVDEKERDILVSLPHNKKSMERGWH